MSFALNEVEATSKKATRGIGFSWGIAEEAAKATRWLCAQGLPGCETLAAVLTDNDGKTMGDVSPMSLDGVWVGASGRLCPLMAGASLNDCAGKLTLNDISMNNVSNPMMLLPFTHAAARHVGATVSISWDGFSARCDGNRATFEGTPDAVSADVVVSLMGSVTKPEERETRATPSGDSWQLLNQLAQRTYAPATEQSRLFGAGAGTTDND